MSNYFQYALLIGAIGCGLGCQSGNQPQQSSQQIRSNKQIPPAKTLQVALRPQLKHNWCWAASGQMVMEYLDPQTTVTQCDEAKFSLGVNECCGNAATNCDVPGWPDFKRFGFTCKVRDPLDNPDNPAHRPLNWNEIRREIGRFGRPIAFAWHWNKGGGHMMVAVGYRVERGAQIIVVNDPLPEPETDAPGGRIQFYPMTVFTGGPGQDHSHWKDFYEIAKVPNGAG